MDRVERKHFYQLESQNQTRNAITELQINATQTVMSTNAFLRECHAFFKNLYTSEPVDLGCQNWLLDQLDSSLSLDDQATCKGSNFLTQIF